MCSNSAREPQGLAFPTPAVRTAIGEQPELHVGRCSSRSAEQCGGRIIWVRFRSAFNTAALFLEFDLRQDNYSITSTEYAALTVFKKKKVK